MISHILCILLFVLAYFMAKILVKAEYCPDCDNAVNEAQNIINQKFITHEQH